MKRNYLLAIVILALAMTSCESEKTAYLTGELYFPWLKMGSFYGEPDSVFQYYIQMRDSLGFEQLKKDDPDGADYMMMLEQNNLLLQPYVYLHIQGDQNALLFMDSAAYNDFKKFDYQKLRKQKQKVTVKATVKKLRPLMYDAQKINRLDVVDGETLPVETKYRIENYQ